MLSLETDDSQDQTRAVLAKVAETVGDQGVYSISDIVDVAPWHDFQRWLAAGNRNVVIPYAEAICGYERHDAIKAKLTAEERDELVDYALSDLIREIGRHRKSPEATAAFLADLAMREAADAVRN